MKRFLTTVLLTAAIAGAQAENTFILDIDDASRVRFETGMTSATYVEQALVNGANTITQSGSEDFVLTPKTGYLIESITAYDAAGTAQASSGWTYSKTDDSYKIYFLGSRQPAARYVVKTKVDTETPWTLTIDINNADAVLNSTFKIGDTSYKPQSGPQTISYKASKGIQFYMQLRPAVADVSFTRDGTATAPAGTMANGTRTYKFNLTDGEKIVIDATMEKPEYYLDIDDPERIEAFYPNSSTPLSGLKAGRNTLEFSYGSTLSIQAKDGYRITGLANMSMNPTTDVYSYTFSDGDSGMVFNCTTEEYTKPIATFILNLDNPDYVGYTSGLPTNTFSAGDNVFEINLDKTKSVTLNYSYKYDGKLMGSLNGVPFEIAEPENYWDSSSTKFDNLEQGKTYRVVIREKLSGEYEGTVGVDCADNYTVWTVSFDPAGIMELTEGSDPPVINTVSTPVSYYVASGVEAGENEMTIRFNETIPEGEYTIIVPAGTCRINGAYNKEIRHNFTVVATGVATIGEDSGEAPRWFNLQGVEISGPQEGQMVIEVRGGKSTKKIFRY